MFYKQLHGILCTNTAKMSLNNMNAVTSAVTISLILVLFLRPVSSYPYNLSLLYMYHRHIATYSLIFLYYAFDNSMMCMTGTV